MARIRTIKPEILEDERTAELRYWSFRLFISMSVMADDFGNLRADERLLQRRAWWARGTQPRVGELLRELADADLIIIYAVRNQIYSHLRGWAKHQRIDNAGTSRIPEPSDDEAILAANFREFPRLAAGSGREEEGKGVSGTPDETPPVLMPVEPAQQFAEVAIAEINRIAGTKYKPDSAAVVKLCRALVRAKHTSDQAVRVVQSKSAWVGDAKMGEYFRPATLLAATNFAKYLDDLEAKAPAQPRLVLAASNGNAPTDNEPDLSYSLVALMGDA